MFNKENLTTGDVLKVRSGREFIYFSNKKMAIETAYDGSNFQTYSMSDNLTNNGSVGKDWDIMTVTRDGKVVFNRVEKPTYEELEVKIKSLETKVALQEVQRYSLTCTIEELRREIDYRDREITRLIWFR